MPARPIRQYVPGAPVQVGTVVVIGEPSDETCDLRCCGRSGVVDHLEYDCGCGQSFPGDPMIGVRFDDGQVAEFWIEELLVEDLEDLGAAAYKTTADQRAGGPK